MCIRDRSTTPKTTSSTVQTVEYVDGATVSNVNGIVNLYGVWEYKFYNVNIVADSSAGSVAGGGSYQYGTQVTLTATANLGYEFVGWDTNGDGTEDITNNPYVVTVTSDLSLTAIFKQVIRIDIKTNNAQFGLVLYNGVLQEMATNVPLGNGVLSNIYAMAKPGSAFLYWLDQTSGQIYAENPLNYTVTQSTTLVAVFSNGLVDGVSVSVEQIAGVSLAAIGEARITGYTTLDGIDYVHFSAVAYKGYYFVGWRVNGEILAGYTESANIPYSIVENKQVFAVFAPINDSNLNEDLDNGQAGDIV